MASDQRNNREALEELARRTRRGPAVEAVRAGQAVLVAGLRRRVPVRTGRLLSSVRASRVGIGAHSVGGAVSVSTRYAAAVEKLDHYLAETARGDGPAALAAMAAVIMRGL
jgi:hypothetical protein